MFNQQPQQGQGLDLRQLEVLRQQQTGQKAILILNIAKEFFVAGKVESITDAFILAEQFVAEFERRYLTPQQKEIQQ
jgi:anthranilate phosphoribosyltransferase